MAYTAPVADNVNFQLTSGYTNPAKDALYFPQQPFLFPSPLEVTSTLTGKGFWGDMVRDSVFTSEGSMSATLGINVAGYFTSVNSLQAVVHFEIATIPFETVNTLFTNFVGICVLKEEFTASSEIEIGGYTYSTEADFTSVASMQADIYFELGIPDFESVNTLFTNFTGLCVFKEEFTSTSEIEIPVLAIGVNPVFNSVGTLEPERIFTYCLVDFTVNTGLGTDNHFMINHPIKDVEYHLIKFQYGTYVTAVQSILNEIKGSLEGVTSGNVITFRNSLIRGDETFASLMLLNNLPNDVNGVQKLLQTLSTETTGIRTLINTLTDAEISAIQALSNTLDAVDYASSYLLVKQSLNDLTTTVYNYETKVYIDNVQVNKTIGNNTIEISFSQTNIHNEILISSISQELFDWADPSINPGTPRLEVQIGSRVMFFLIEKRDGSGTSFTLWGRDQTARDSAPWSLSSSYYLSEPRLASEVAAEVTNYSAVDWDADLYDWILPETFEVEGTPTEILSAIAQEIGGVVRAQDDGSLLLRKKYSIRPISMVSAVADIIYNADQVVDFSHSKVTGEHYNIVAVTSTVPDSLLAQVDVEELEEGEERDIGRTSFVRAYLTNTSPTAFDSYVTDGSIVQIPGPFVNGAFQEEYEEIVEFKEGVAETSYPIYHIDSTDDYANSVEWIGDSGEIVDWNKYGSTLTLDNLEHFRLAKVTYTVEFQRYELSGHNVEELLAVFFYTDYPNLNVTVKSSQIAFDENGDLVDKIGTTITTDNLQVDTSAAVARGTSWIDDNKYDKYEHGFTSPYNDRAVDGNIVWVDCSRIGLVGNYYISDVSIVISGGVVMNTLKVTQWEV